MERDTFTDTTLKRIRSGEKSHNTKKKRKASRIFLIIDGILIIILLTFIFNKKPEQIYKSTTLNYKDLNIRFSIKVLSLYEMILCFLLIYHLFVTAQ